MNLWIPTDLRPPAPAAQVADDAVRAVHGALNPMRATLGLPPTSARPPAPPDLLPEALEVVLEERVPVFSAALGDPGPEMVAECMAASDIFKEAAVQGDPDYFPLAAGQSVGLIHDLPGAAEVVATTISEARAVLLEKIPGAVTLGG